MIKNIRYFKKGMFFVLAGLVLFSFALSAQELPIEEKLAAIYEKAEQAIEQDNKEEADFWMARYMGLTSFNLETERNFSDLYPLFEKREDLLKSAAFISGKYTDSFIEFFLMVTHQFWGIPEEGIKEDLHQFAVRANSDGKYFAQVVISPFLESRTVIKDKNSLAVIPLGSLANPPFLVSGKLENNEPVKRFPAFVLDTEQHFLHYVWPIEFHDLDKDNIPEIWIRYNAAWADGFSQMLDIYKIEDDEKLVLFKKFEGKSEGIARRLSDGTIEVGEGFGTGAHLDFDQFRITTWQYKEGIFEKTDEKVIPHILLSEEWENYYFE